MNWRERLTGIKEGDKVMFIRREKALYYGGSNTFQQTEYKIGDIIIIVELITIGNIRCFQHMGHTYNLNCVEKVK